MKKSATQTDAAQMRDRIARQWPDLSEFELDRIGTRPERLYHALIQKYGISRDEAARQLWSFLRSPQKAAAQ